MRKAIVETIRYRVDSELVAGLESRGRRAEKATLPSGPLPIFDPNLSLLIFFSNYIPFLPWYCD